MSAQTDKMRTVRWLVGVVLTMGALAWASVPLYTIFCQITGYGGTTNSAEAEADEILERTMKVRFDATLEKGMPWTFKPVEREMEIRIGETGLAFYEAHNPTDRPVAGQASYNVTPFYAGEFFSKIECFCFTEQVLQPGETVQMPVSFYVDPAIVDDPDAKFVKHITLSYTFYEIDLPDEERQASLPTN
ncbi:cytochrome c oxidase assembly protein [Palleronia caenipelagi]|uniref:Cytochrome c oxidase assembly protein CtaG n=1 Tax=Palleronia caenipelagi TaxID=2489174 RepID=A0A547Q7X8_9RHOB|nr:cytochrome c oxidase assembly protein [Palleronia caenipelagi]TRD22469.1 cytochrome c oxidase assembly protein [Palleronia caenipelagi]